MGEDSSVRQRLRGGWHHFPWKKCMHACIHTYIPAYIHASPLFACLTSLAWHMGVMSLHLLHSHDVVAPRAMDRSCWCLRVHSVGSSCCSLSDWIFEVWPWDRAKKSPECHRLSTKHSSGWWFQTFLFSIIYGMSSFPLTFIFFKMAKTTNQSCFARWSETHFVPRDDKKKEIYAEAFE